MQITINGTEIELSRQEAQKVIAVLDALTDHAIENDDEINGADLVEAVCDTHDLITAHLQQS